MERTKMVVNMDKGFGKLKMGSRVYFVLNAGGLWNLSYHDYSKNFLQIIFLAENKKRFSTIQKYALEQGIELVPMEV